MYFYTTPLFIRETPPVWSADPLLAVSYTFCDLFLRFSEVAD